MTLVILAAGMGSRYGGLKQIDPIGPEGEFIIDYSVYDAMRAGFDKVVFIIKREHYEEFAETIGARVGTKIKTAYAFQEMEALPGGYTVPKERSKPWGTAHALLCAREAVGSDTFAVINADDFYGRESYEKMAAFLRSIRPDAQRPYPFAMCGFFTYNGMPAERFLLAVIRSEILCPRTLAYHPQNLYAELLLDSSTMREVLTLD